MSRILIQFCVILVVKIKHNKPAGIPAGNRVNADYIRTIFHISGQMIENRAVIQDSEVLMPAFLARKPAVILFWTYSILVISVPAGAGIGLVFCPFCVKLLPPMEYRTEQFNVFCGNLFHHETLWLIFARRGFNRRYN